MLVLISALSVWAGIRPSFFLQACAWNATEILVIAPTEHLGTFKVIETIRGDLVVGATLDLPGLAPSPGVTGKLSELAGSDDPFGLGHPFEGVPPIEQEDRLIVFLRKAGAPFTFDPNPKSQLVDGGDGWQSANFMGDLRVSTVWIQDGVTYGFGQRMNPGPSQLTPLQVSQADLRERVEAVLKLRRSFDQAVATADPAARSRQLVMLVRSGNGIARDSAIRQLARGGDPEANALLGLLGDESLLGWHQDIVGALLQTGVPVSFDQFLPEETAYWSKTCHVLRSRWWNEYPINETPRNHYTRVYSLLRGIQEWNLTGALPAVRDFSVAWRACPPLEELERSNQISDELTLLLGADR